MLVIGHNACWRENYSPHSTFNMIISIFKGPVQPFNPADNFDWTKNNSFDFPTHNTFHSWITSPEFISLSPRSDIQFTTTVLMRWSGSYLKASANATDTFYITRGN